MKKKFKNLANLGQRIHEGLNITLTRKLTMAEYSELVLLIANVFDLAQSPKDK